MSSSERQHRIYELLMELAETTFGLRKYSSACVHLESAFEVAMALDDLERLKPVLEVARKFSSAIEKVPVDILQQTYDRGVLLERYTHLQEMIKKAINDLEANPGT